MQLVNRPAPGAGGSTGHAPARARACSKARTISGTAPAASPVRPCRRKDSAIVRPTGPAQTANLLRPGKPQRAAYGVLWAGRGSRDPAAPTERGSATAHVDEGIRGRDPGRIKHPKRHGWTLLEPAPRVIALGVGGVPVRRCLCVVRHLPILRAAGSPEGRGRRRAGEETPMRYRPAVGHSQV